MFTGYLNDIFFFIYITWFDEYILKNIYYFQLNSILFKSLARVIFTSEKKTTDKKLFISIEFPIDYITDVIMMLMAVDQSTHFIIEPKRGSWYLFIPLIVKTVLTTPECCPLYFWNFRFCLAYQQIVVLDKV